MHSWKPGETVFHSNPFSFAPPNGTSRWRGGPIAIIRLYRTDPRITTHSFGFGHILDQYIHGQTVQCSVDITMISIMILDLVDGFLIKPPKFSWVDSILIMSARSKYNRTFNHWLISNHFLASCGLSKKMGWFIVAKLLRIHIDNHGTYLIMKRKIP